MHPLAVQENLRMERESSHSIIIHGHGHSCTCLAHPHRQCVQMHTTHLGSNSEVAYSICTYNTVQEPRPGTGSPPQGTSVTHAVPDPACETTLFMAPELHTTEYYATYRLCSLQLTSGVHILLYKLLQSVIITK